MESGPSTLVPRLASLPIDLVYCVLELSLEHDDGRVKPWRAWVSRVALVSKFANRIAIPRLYGIIQLDAGRKVVLLATTLANRHDLARRVRGLHITAALPTRHDQVWRDIQVGDEALAQVQSSSLELIAICKNTFLQVSDTAFDSNGFLTGLGPAQHAPASYHYLSMTCISGVAVPLDTDLPRTTHLHFGIGEDTPGWVFVVTTSSFARSWDRLTTTVMTHVAFDWDLEENSRASLTSVIRNMLSKEPNTLQRVTIRLPVFTKQSTPAREGRRQARLRKNLAMIGDPRVFLSLIEVKSSRAEGGMHEMALEGWRRHAQGLEDLWMSGQPVYTK